MNLEDSYPANYHITNVDRVISKIKGTSSVTIISPAGFGKSHLLRFLAFNKKYKTRYKNLKNIEFIYIDLTELKLENANNQEFNTLNPGFYHPTAIDNITRVFLKEISKKLIEKEPYFTSDLSLNGLELRNQLNYTTELLLKKFRNKIFYIELDGTEVFLDQQMEQCFSFLKYFRDNFKGRVEYVFTLTDMNVMQAMLNVKHGAFSAIFSHNISVLTLTHFKEIYRSRSTSFKRKYEELFKNRSAQFKKWQDDVTYLTGGYPPYCKFIEKFYPLPSNLNLTQELVLISENLLRTLTPNQAEILIKVTKKQPIEPSNDLSFLLETGLVKNEANTLKPFSPIFEVFINTLQA